MRSSMIMPLLLSSSYFTLEPKGISMTELNSFGIFGPGEMSCHAWTMKRKPPAKLGTRSCALPGPERPGVIVLDQPGTGSARLSRGLQLCLDRPCLDHLHRAPVVAKAAAALQAHDIMRAAGRQLVGHIHVHVLLPRRRRHRKWHRQIVVPAAEWQQAPSLFQQIQLLPREERSPGTDLQSGPPTLLLTV